VQPFIGAILPGVIYFGTIKVHGFLQQQYDVSTRQSVCGGGIALVTAPKWPHEFYIVFTKFANFNDF